MRGDIPLPEGRPYTLGNTSADVASISATSEMTASRRRQADASNTINSRAVSYDGGGQAMPAPRPVSAYAPVQRGFTNDPMSGRGLY